MTLALQATSAVRTLALRARIAGAVVAAWMTVALTWPLWLWTDPQSTDIVLPFSSPSSSHVLGTDALGRDVLARMIAGASETLLVAPLATLLALVVGGFAGLLAGYRGGWLDALVSRVIDGILAFPAIVIVVVVVVVAAVGTSRTTTIVVIGLLFAPYVARTVRAATLVQREREYVAAARLVGHSTLSVALRQLLPNVAPVLVVEGTVRLGYAVFAEATLSFLGLGLTPPSPDWGVTISEGRENLGIAPWTVLAPAAAIASVVVSINLFADALERRADA